MYACALGPLSKSHLEIDDLKTLISGKNILDYNSVSWKKRFIKNVQVSNGSRKLGITDRFRMQVSVEFLVHQKKAD